MPINDSLEQIIAAAAAARQEAEALSAELIAQQEALAAALAAHAGCAANETALSAKIASLEAEKALLNSQVSTQALAIATLQTEVGTLQNQVVTLQTEVVKLKAELKALTPTTVPPVTVILNGTTYELDKTMERPSFRDTTRYEMPLTDGLVFVLLHTAKHGHASYVVERHKPGVYGTAMPLLDYAIRIVDTDFGVDVSHSIVGHGQWQRWRHQNKLWPEASVDPKLVFGFDTRSTPSGLSTISAADVAPLGRGDLVAAMGTTGLRGDIGCYTGWLARGLRTGNLTQARMQAEAAASIPWHVRGDDGKPVLLSGPENLARQMKTYYGTHSKIDNTIDENTSWSMDTAHMPKVAWGGFIANSNDPDPYMIEELQYEAAAAIGQAAGSYTRSSNGLYLTRSQGRDYAWGMVSLAHALVATPDETPDWLIPRAKLVELVEANLNLGVELTKDPAFQFESVALGKNSRTTASGRVSMQSNVIDYIPLAMAHCYRITGDLRFMTIGRAHLDGRIAKRWKASPKYAALYPPVSIGTGTDSRPPQSWEEAYRQWGWSLREAAIATWLKANAGKTRADAEVAVPPVDRTSTVDSPMGPWLRPTGTERDIDGDYLMPYTSEQMIPITLLMGELYQEMGFSTPDIDWFVAYLNGRRGTGGYTIYEQFAITA